MSVKRKDFQKIATTIHQFLLKLTDTYECAELRDSLNLSLLQLQKYYRKCQQRLQHTGRYKLENSGSGYVSPRQSLRITLSRSRDETLSPMTPYIEEPQYFHATWTILEERAEFLRKSLSEENMNPQRSINTPPVHYAAMTADFDMLTELHTQKTDVLEDQDCIGRTPMMYAAFHNKLSVVRWLLEHGANPNSCDFNEVTSLHWSCSQGHVRVIELLLDAGADKDYQDSFGRSATHWACTLPSLDVLHLLIEFGANVNMHDRNGLTPTMWACRLDYLAHLKMLSSVEKQKIDHIDGYERDRNGRTIIHWSIRRKSPFECLKYLLNEETAQLKDDEGKTVLLLAAEQGALETCKIIIDMVGTRFLSDVDDKDRTCLHLATVGGHGEVVNFMLENGMNLNCKDKTGATSMDIARNQYLFYCQLIISSHIREQERKLDSVASDGVEVIHNIISRHNSISDSRNHVVTPPRPPKSPKSMISTPQNVKSPTLKRRLQTYGSNSDQNGENSNEFDVMSSDPVNNQCTDLGPLERSMGHYEVEPVVELEGEETLKLNLQNAHYQEAESIDRLDNDTGQQYHSPFNHMNNQEAPPVNSSNCTTSDVQNVTSVGNIQKRTMKRAQKVNRINSANSDRSSESKPITTPSTNEYVPKIERESAQIQRPMPVETVPRINYGATLEPIRNESQLNPRRKKKRSNNQKRNESLSQDRFDNSSHSLHFSDPDHSLAQARSLENMSLKSRELPNGLVNKPQFPSPNPINFDWSNKSTQNKNRVVPSFFSNNNVKPRDLWKNEELDKMEKKQSKHIQDLHLSKSNRSTFPNF